MTPLQWFILALIGVTGALSPRVGFVELAIVGTVTAVFGPDQ